MEIKEIVEFVINKIYKNFPQLNIEIDRNLYNEIFIIIDDVEIYKSSKKEWDEMIKELE